MSTTQYAITVEARSVRLQVSLFRAISEPILRWERERSDEIARESDPARSRYLEHLRSTGPDLPMLRSDPSLHRYLSAMTNMEMAS